MTETPQDDIDQLLGAILRNGSFHRRRAWHLLWSLDEDLRDAVFDVCQGLLTEDVHDAPFAAHWAMSFEDLCELQDRAIQTVLREVERHTLVVALRGASEPLQRRFEDNMSARLWTLIADDVALPATYGAAEIRRARQKILKIVVRLRQAGEIPPQ